MEYNEDDAIKYIRAALGEGANPEITDDELLNVIDMIWDYYEDKGLLDINADPDDDVEIDTDDLIAYVRKMVAKDKRSPITPDDVDKIVTAEIEYEEKVESSEDE